MTSEIDQSISGRHLTLALAAVVLGLALHLTDGLYSPLGIAVLAPSLLLCAAGAIAPIRQFTRLDRATFHTLLIGLIALQLLAMLFKPAGASAHTVPIVSQQPFDAGIACALLAVAMIGFGRRRLMLTGLVLLLVTHAAIGVWKIRTAPKPFIDVFVFQTDSAQALRNGVNPYTITFPNIYGTDTRVYGPDIVREGRLRFGYPYPPLVLLWTSPAQWLLGDFRYAQLAAMLLAGVMIAAMGRNRTSFLVAALLLFTPRSFYVLEMGWTEPLSVMLLAATVLCLVRAPMLSPVALGLLLASKQYMPAAVVLAPFLTWHGFSTRVLRSHGWGGRPHPCGARVFHPGAPPPPSKNPPPRWLRSQCSSPQS